MEHAHQRDGDSEAPRGRVRVLRSCVLFTSQLFSTHKKVPHSTVSPAHARLCPLRSLPCPLLHTNINDKQRTHRHTTQSHTTHIEPHSRHTRCHPIPSRRTQSPFVPSVARKAPHKAALLPSTPSTAALLFFISSFTFVRSVPVGRVRPLVAALLLAKHSAQ